MDKEKLIKLAEDLYQSAFDANAYYAIMMQYREMSKKYNNEMNLSSAFYQLLQYIQVYDLRVYSYHDQYEQLY